MSDHAECHIRGSRVIFASYRDNMGQIQKFAMRFSSCAEAQTFMESLKCLQDQLKVGCSDAMLSSVFHHRIAQEPSYVNQSAECTLQCQPSINQEHLPYLCSQQAMFNNPTEVLDFSLPTSFTALLSERCAETKPDMLDKIDGIMTLLGGDLAL
ncbi:hypothetical protein Cgig2_012758 [Carnegiea gigantea]|uniref:Poor homologous synapsis 1 PH domain-containing protein n=1 Tax=Carnegiea gigantea TaxID=171969 RepID=A0A9Q1QFK2_9CARY|nr:hypothetical protein Cgig2_012758 [Carnegiea gigantea]